MSTSLLLLLLAADPVPPVVGRPLDFSGAVGGPFAVTLSAEPTALAPEEPLTLTLRIVGPGNLAAVRRPDLAKIDAFKDRFAVEPLDEATEPARTFRYRLRPRSAAVTEVPPVKFVFFNPKVPVSRGYQTTYSQPVPLTVKAKTPTPVGPAEVPAWMLELPTRDEFDLQPVPLVRWLHARLANLGLAIDDTPSAGVPAAVFAFLLALPPLLCGAWYGVWRRRNPAAARRAALHRSRAAADALRALRKPSPDIAAVVTDYLRRRYDLSDDVVGDLRSQNRSERLIAETATLLRRSDAARFAPACGDPAVPDDAERLILAWEAEP